MADEATIVIDGDTSGFVRSGEKIGETLRKSAKEGAGALNDEMIKVNTHFTHALMRATALVHVIKAVASASNKIAGEQAQGNRDAGNNIVKGYQTMQRLGSQNPSQEYDTWMGMGGGTTLEQRRSDLDSLAGFMDGKPGRLSGAKRVAAMRAMVSGAFGWDEIHEKLKRGEALPTDKDVAERLKTTPDAVKQQYAIRDFERDNDVRSENANLSYDAMGNRLYESVEKRQKAENPGLYGVRETIKEGLSVVGGDQVIDAASRYTVKGVIGKQSIQGSPEDRDTGYRFGDQNTLEKIEQNTRPFNVMPLRVMPDQEH